MKLRISILDNIAIDIVNELFPELALEENPSDELTEEQHTEWKKLESIVFRNLRKGLENDLTIV